MKLALVLLGIAATVAGCSPEQSASDGQPTTATLATKTAEVTTTAASTPPRTADTPATPRERPSLLDPAVLASVERVDAAIRAGADLEARDASGRTPLLLATREDRVAVARRLIEAGADVNAKDAIQDTPYLYAAAEGRLHILELTLAHGANLRDTNRFGGTGLIPAAHHGHVEVVRRLLRTDIEVDHVNNLGWTALLEAVILGDGGPMHAEIVRLLLEAGADPHLADGNGVTPLAHAERRGYEAIARLLRTAAGA